MAGFTGWKTYLQGCIPCTFPTLLEDGDDAKPETRASISVTLAEPYCRLTSFSDHHAVDSSTVLCAAWGIVLQAYTGLDSVSFAVSRPDIRPCRIDLASHASVSEVISAVAGAHDGEAHGLDISAMHPSRDDDGFTAKEFFNTCVMCPGQGSQASRETSDGLDQFDIVVLFKVEDSAVRIILRHSSALLAREQAAAVVNALERAVSDMVGGQDRLEQVCLVNAADRDEMGARNTRRAEEGLGAGIEALIGEHWRRTPSALAVCAWDGDFSYEEVGDLSAGLMGQLRDLGVGAETFVPVLFEKSRWAVIAMVGVMRAGGAFALLDPTHPPGRLRGICDDMAARVIVSSSRQAGLAAGLAGRVVTVGDGEAIATAPAKRRHGQQGGSDGGERHPTTDCFALPENALYAVFTSGSTGTPKGVVSKHSSFLAAVPAYIEGTGLDGKARVFQFASYAFDAAIFDMLMTLVAGGCVCVPSSTDRTSDLADAISRFGTTHLSLTPTVARILEPRQVPSLQTIVLGGERLTPDDVGRWTDHVRVVQLYGATECAVVSMRCTSPSSSSSSSSSGVVRTTSCDTGSRCWVVDPASHERLRPAGAVGELVVEGPLLARGYLNDAARTSETFVESPTWLRALERRSGTVYKSGDLVRLAADGSVQFVCRKNTRVKLRGQRIELGEVEHQLKLAIPSAAECVAELVTAVDASRPPMLVAFVLSRQSHDDNDDDDDDDNNNNNDVIAAGRNATSDTAVLAEPTVGFRSQIPSISSAIRRVLPSYMVPSAILPLNILPLTASDKANRRLLRQLAAEMSREELERYQSPREETTSLRAPAGDAEKALQEAFAEVLGLPLDRIGADDNFFSLGGDSLTAMKLVVAARKVTLGVTVQSVFDHPQLSELALDAKRAADKDVAREKHRVCPRPFALVAGMKTSIVRDAARQCHLPGRVFQDAYPCTQLQKGLFAETMRDASSSVANIELALSRDVDIARLRQAWTAVAKANPILRTRMILSASHGLLQLVVGQDVPLTEEGDDEEGRCQHQEAVGVVGSPLVRLILLRRDADADEGVEAPNKLLLRIHHAAYDGYTLPLMFEQLAEAYRGATLPFRPVSPFVRYLATMADATDHWRCLCQGLETPSFPVVSEQGRRPRPDSKKIHHVAVPHPRARQYTPNTHVRLAWAMTQARRQRVQDVFFGTVVSGRNAPVDGIESIMMPTLATVPCRVTLDARSTVRDMLDGMQDVATRGIPYEQLGLSEIARLGKHAARACSFQTLLVIQPALERAGHGLFDVSYAEADYRADALYAVNLFCELERQGLRVTALYDERTVPAHTMQTMLDTFGQAVRTVYTTPEILIGDVSLDGI
uniref:Lysergyl peptide synthetase subunit 2 n=1 Tax=Claviceps paspali TaxID=40601 RepID=G8GV81_CLAPA|nr:lysergyl peptide synthetase subunit 2 [Claviceps paspali]